MVAEPNEESARDRLECASASPMSSPSAPFDLVVVGAGINGAGVARDAAGRGLSVLLVEQGDIASATSSWSTKLVHGGLRYLEHYEFRLVHEALAEREVVLRSAPHLVQPLSFVLPHEPHLRPMWMIRAGLFLYDHLGRRETLPASFAADLVDTCWGAGLKPQFRKGFVYADARVDDARLVLVNALSARLLGADVRVRTRMTRATRRDAMWHVTLAGADGRTEHVSARALVNATGPWVKRVRDAITDAPARERVRHVKGSHIVVPRVHGEDHAYILQNRDKRIVFVIPYEERYSLIGTTDVPVDAFEHPTVSEEEIAYLLELANAYLAKPLVRDDVVWTYSGVRPLFDDGASDPSAITRDYVLRLDRRDAQGREGAPVLSVFGGKLTTYRKLAEAVLASLAPFFPAMKPAWTESAPLPGGDLPGGLSGWTQELARGFPAIAPEVLRGLARRHGRRALDMLDGVRRASDMGPTFGRDLTAREIDFFVREEWARDADDVLWRRSKCGLGMSAQERSAVAAEVARSLSASAAVA
jgi:glycerol-3-phosphate dehydrogenase